MIAVSALEDFLAGKDGLIADRDKLVSLLSEEWGRLSGEVDDLGSQLHRIENPRYEAPYLRFELERHGETEPGSTRALAYTYRLDVRSGTVDIEGSKRRQVRPAAKPLDVRPLAQEVARLIVNQVKDDPRVRFLPTGGAQVITQEVLPPAAKATWEGRLRRFYQVLDAEMEKHGFVRSGSVYQPSHPRSIRSVQPSRKGGPMALSPLSRDSVLSIASKGSVLSIGSTGSALSIGSVGSFASAFSIGSAGSVGSIFSAGSVASVFSAGGNGHTLGHRAKWREVGTVAGTLTAVTLAIVIRRAVR